MPARKCGALIAEAFEKQAGRKNRVDAGPTSTQAWPSRTSRALFRGLMLVSRRPHPSDPVSRPAAPLVTEFRLRVEEGGEGPHVDMSCLESS